jgi:predicted Zn-dependent protease
VLCHELGHLLGLVHSESGLMRAEWNPKDFDPRNLWSILFTSSDCQRIHAQAAARFAKENE